MDATRRGDDRRQEGVTQAVGRVALPIFINLHLSPLIEREIKVLMAQGAIQRGVVSAAEGCGGGCSASCSLDAGLQQCAVYRVQSAYILAVSRYGDNGLQQRSVYVTPGRLDVWRRHRRKLASMHAKRE